MSCAVAEQERPGTQNLVLLLVSGREERQTPPLLISHPIYIVPLLKPLLILHIEKS